MRYEDYFTDQEKYISQILNYLKLHNQFDTKKINKTLILERGKNSNFEKNINIRSAICKIENLNCYSFLQPFATVHGNYFTTRNGVKLKNGDSVAGAPEIGKLGSLGDTLLRKYQILKEAKGAINISSSLDSLNELAWCDTSHYCPNANEMIAKSIYLEIQNNLN